MKLKILITEVSGNLQSQRDGAMKLLRYVYGNDIEIKKTPSGKPYIEGDFTDSVYKYFNISHSGNYSVCAFADVPVGIDIEKIHPVSKRVIDRFLNSCAPEDAIRMWTRRESFGKMTGGGFVDTRYDTVLHTFREYNDIDGYIITVCVSRSGRFIVSDADFPEYVTWYEE